MLMENTVKVLHSFSHVSNHTTHTHTHTMETKHNQSIQPLRPHAQSRIVDVITSGYRTSARTRYTFENVISELAADATSELSNRNMTDIPDSLYLVIYQSYVDGEYLVGWTDDAEASNVAHIFGELAVRHTGAIINDQECHTYYLDQHDIRTLIMSTCNA